MPHLDAVYRMAMHLARNPADASDLVQETYLKAIRACETFEDRGRGVRPWLFKILHNTFYSKVRKERNQPLTVDEFHNESSDQLPPDAPLPGFDLASLDWEHVDERLKAAIDDLRPEYRTILLLWGVEGMKYREIAAIEDVPIGTIMSRLHRARSILARELADLAEEIGMEAH